jgi:hypothetical protein
MLRANEAFTQSKDPFDFACAKTLARHSQDTQQGLNWKFPEGFLQVSGAMRSFDCDAVRFADGIFAQDDMS